jgi:ClpP class serine protease
MTMRPSEIRREERQNKRAAANVLAAITRSHWAITREALETIKAIAQRTNLDPKAIELARGEPLRNTRDVTVRDGIATLPVQGPMVRYADIFSRVSGATSYQDLATDFKAALDDRSVKAIVFDFDSPGGAVNGCFELAREVFAARGIKPIIAYVSNQACSGAYSIAAACDEIVTFDTALLGCLGALFGWEDNTAALADAGIKEYVLVSSQTPHKDIDPATAEGRSAMQVILDELAAVMISDIGTFRAMSPEKVVERFAAERSVYVGASAVDIGLADRISSYEALHAELLARETTPQGAFVVKARTISSSTARDQMADKVSDKTTPAPAAAAAPVAGARAEGGPPADKEKKKDGEDTPPTAAGGTADENTDDEETETAPKPGEPGYEAHVRTIAAAAERKRIGDIRALGKPGEEATIQACIDDHECSVEQAAVRLRLAETKAGADRLAALRTDDAGKHPSGIAASAVPATPEAAARKSVADYYALTQPKGPTPRDR